MPPLLTRAQTEGTPLVDGEQVTFVWTGARPPYLLGEFNDWDFDRAAPLVEAAPGVWTQTIRAPRDALLEYAYVTDRRHDGRSNQYTTPDPFNPRTKSNGIGGRNHYFYMPESQPTPLVRRRRGIARGTILRHDLPTGDLAAGRTRRVALYRPPVEGPVPLLVVLDGDDYLRQARLDAIVDNLIAAGQLPPLAMALVWNGRDARLVEYGGNDVTVAFLRHRVLPLAQAELDLVDVAAHPGGYGILGASMGGLMALYTALRLPQIFGRVYSQAGAFTLDPDDTVVYELVRRLEPPPLRIWLDNGSYDFLYETNVRMHNLLREKGYRVHYNEYNAGHNYYAWRDQLAQGLAMVMGE